MSEVYPVALPQRRLCFLEQLRPGTSIYNFAVAVKLQGRFDHVGLGRAFDALMEAGKPHGIANAGYRAIESLRLEKGYRAWGADIGPDHSPLVAGLGWAVKLKSDTPFQGRAALKEQIKKPLPRLLAGFTTDPEIVLLGRETIYRDGGRVGWLTSGGYGYTVGRSIGYGYVRDPEEGVDRDKLLSGRYELVVATERVPAEVFLDPLYDPKMARIKR